MDCNIELYSGILVSSEVCRAYIYPSIEKFMDDKNIDQDTQYEIKEQINKEVDNVFSEYHRRARSKIESAINNKIEDLIDCQVILLDTNYYDIYVTLTSACDKDQLAYDVMYAAEQSVKGICDDILLDGIDSTVNTILKNQISKDINLDFHIEEFDEGMEVVEIN